MTERDYDPNGDMFEKIGYHTHGHFGILDPMKMRRFQDYLRANPNAPVEEVSSMFDSLLGEQAEELFQIAEEFEVTEDDGMIMSVRRLYLKLEGLLGGITN